MIMGEAVNAWYAPPTFFDVVVFILSTLMTAAGFVIAIHQVNKTRNAVNAARVAEAETSSDFAASQLIGLLREIPWAVGELDEDNRRGSPASFSRTLVRYARLCNESANLISKLEMINTEFIATFQNSARQALDAKGSLSSGTLTTTRDAYSAIALGVTQVTIAGTDCMKTLEFQLRSERAQREKESA